MKRRVMLVDDDDAVLQALRRLLRRLPCAYGVISYELEIELFTAPGAALARAREQAFDAIVCDYRMPEMDGIAFLKQVRTLRPDAVPMLISGGGDRDAVERAFAEVGIFRFIAKPWDDATLVSALAESLNFRDLMLEQRLEQREPDRQ